MVPGHSRDGTALLSQGMVRPRNCLDSGSGVLKDIIFLGSTFVNPSNERTKYHFDARLLNWGRGVYVSHARFAPDGRMGKRGSRRGSSHSEPMGWADVVFIIDP